MKVAVIGVGYWGPNLIRNFLSLNEVSNVIACDCDEALLGKMRSRFIGIETETDYEKVLERSDVQIVAIATPVSTHFEIAKKSLLAGKHCWIEKPMTHNVQEAEELIALAEEKKLKLFVDHTFIYTGAVRKMKEIISSGRLGDLYYFDSVRVNLGIFQHDVNVVWDLAPHDLSIMDYLIGKKPLAVSAVGTCHVGNDLADIAYITLQFENDFISHLHVNWLAPVKVRKILIGGTKSMIVFDDMENSDKLKIYDTGIEIDNREGLYETLVQYRTGDMLSPKLNQTEALTVATQHFIDCVLNDKTPITDGVAGLNVVRILEATSASINNNGKFIAI